ncbi:MAG: polymerase sigma factor [Gammaproteobacteria bacterium]|nr:polymerase sigma factor [Gammaproteobacteria bacterium]
MSDAEPKRPEASDTLTSEMLRTYSPRLHYYVLRSLRQRPDNVSDVIQETYLRFLRKKDRSEVIRHPLAYLCRIASGVVAENAERESLGVVRFDSELVDEASQDMTFGDMDEISRRLGMHEAVLEAIEQLPAALRAALVLVEGEDMTCKEAARATGYAPNTIKQYLCAARAKMKQLLGDRWSKEDLLK